MEHFGSIIWTFTLGGDLDNPNLIISRKTQCTEPDCPDSHEPVEVLFTDPECVQGMAMLTKQMDTAFKGIVSAAVEEGDAVVTSL